MDAKREADGREVRENEGGDAYKHIQEGGEDEE